MTPKVNYMKPQTTPNHIASQSTSYYNIPRTPGTGMTVGGVSDEDVYSVDFFIAVVWKYIKSPMSVDLSVLEHLLREKNSELVYNASRSISDSRPASTVLWAQDNTMEMLFTDFLIEQIRLKELRHKMMVQLILDVGLWESVDVDYRCMIAVHGEKIALSSALTMLEIDDVGERILMESISDVLNERGVTEEIWASSGMNSSDIFFSQTSRIDDICMHIYLVQMKLLNESDTKEAASVKISTSIILEKIFTSAYKFKIENVDNYQLRDTDLTADYYWIFDNNNRKIILEQIDILKTYLFENNLFTRKDLFLILFNLWDLVLKGYKIESKLNKHIIDQYQEFTREAIDQFRVSNYIDYAKQLAMDHSDFLSLVQMDPDFEKYIKTYGNRFLFFLFEYYLSNGMFSELFGINKLYWNELHSFLSDFPGFSWIHNIQQNKFEECSNTLLDLGKEETSLDRAKLLFSLSKLAAKAGGISDETHFSFLELINHQETIFKNAPESSMLSPQYLIEKCINSGLTLDHIKDFLRAFDILKKSAMLRTDTENQGLLVSMWIKAISLTQWETMAEGWDFTFNNKTITDNIQLAICSTLFFQIAIREEIPDEFISKSVISLAYQSTPRSHPEKKILELTYQLILVTRQNL